MIYSRFGDTITFTRRATLDDVKALENRRPDKVDRQRTADGCRVVARFTDGKERLCDFAYLRADDGLREIQEAYDALPALGLLDGKGGAR